MSREDVKSPRRKQSTLLSDLFFSRGEGLQDKSNKINHSATEKRKCISSELLFHIGAFLWMGNLIAEVVHVSKTPLFC